MNDSVCIPKAMKSSNLLNNIFIIKTSLNDKLKLKVMFLILHLNNRGNQFLYIYNLYD